MVEFHADAVPELPAEMNRAGGHQQCRRLLRDKNRYLVRVARKSFTLAALSF